MDLTAAGFGATVTGGLPEMRAMAESLMVDTVTVSYVDPDAEPVQNPETGSTEPVYAQRFTSKCKIQTRNLQARAEEVGGRTATTVSVELHLPIGAPAVEVGDVCEVTAVGSLSDIQLLGRKFKVVAPVAKTFATARRLEVTEVVS